LEGIRLDGNDLSGWNFKQQDLTGAGLWETNLTSADLRGANLTRAFLWNADLMGANLTEASLSGALLQSSTLTTANLAAANLKSASLSQATVTSANFDAATVYNQWTIFPPGLDPAAEGLTLVVSPPGDLDGNDIFSVTDIDALTHRLVAQRIVGVLRGLWWLPDQAFDLDGDGIANVDDHRVWIQDLKHTWFGDANLDGEFDNSDLLQVLAAGKYEHAVINGPHVPPVPIILASWSEGDWNADGEFTSEDLVVALADGGYDQGRRPAVTAVPEPRSPATEIVGMLGLLFLPRRSDRFVSQELIERPI
jgi:hypothetical protein